MKGNPTLWSTLHYCVLYNKLKSIKVVKLKDEGL